MNRKEATRSGVVGERKELKKRCESDRIKGKKCEKSKIKMLVRMIGRGVLKDRDTGGGRGEPIVGVRSETGGGWRDKCSCIGGGEEGTDTLGGLERTDTAEGEGLKRGR